MGTRPQILYPRLAHPLPSSPPLLPDIITAFAHPSMQPSLPPIFSHTTVTHTHTRSFSFRTKASQLDSLDQPQSSCPSHHRCHPHPLPSARAAAALPYIPPSLLSVLDPTVNKQGNNRRREKGLPHYPPPSRILRKPVSTTDSPYPAQDPAQVTTLLERYPAHKSLNIPRSRVRVAQ